MLWNMLDQLQWLWRNVRRPPANTKRHLRLADRPLTAHAAAACSGSNSFSILSRNWIIHRCTHVGQKCALVLKNLNVQCLLRKRHMYNNLHIAYYILWQCKASSTKCWPALLSHEPRYVSTKSPECHPQSTCYIRYTYILKVVVCNQLAGNLRLYTTCKYSIQQVIF